MEFEFTTPPDTFCGVQRFWGTLLLSGFTSDGQKYEVCYPFRGNWKGLDLSCLRCRLLLPLSKARSSNCHTLKLSFFVVSLVSSPQNSVNRRANSGRLKPRSKKSSWACHSVNPNPTTLCPFLYPRWMPRTPVSSQLRVSNVRIEFCALVFQVHTYQLLALLTVA